MANTILLAGDAVIDNTHQAAAAITPGYLVERATTGKIQKHSSAAGTAQAAFALDQPEFNKGIADAYAANDMVRVGIVQRGAVVYALVAASASAIAIGNYLESAGDGTLRLVATAAATPDTGRSSVVARALDAVDNSAGGSEARITVEAL